MFGGGEQQQRQQQRSQNAPSDSGRYQQMWSGGKIKPWAIVDLLPQISPAYKTS
jgi:hypothetical protein